MFGQSFVKPKLSTFHTFDCPVYSLDTRLQEGQSIPKWDTRCTLGLYLGNYPRHTRTVSFDLNLTTERISPQFHVKHDEYFETISTKHDTTISKWKELAGFSKVIKEKEVTTTNLPQSRPQHSIHPITSQSEYHQQSIQPNLTDDEDLDFGI